MAVDPKKRQKQLAKKAAKRKKVRAAESRRAGGSPSEEREITFVSNAPIHECLVPKGLFEVGLGNVVVSRKTPSGGIAASFFLVDVFCLGVKDTFFRILPKEEYEVFCARAAQEEPMAPISPACARKLVEGVEAYARDLGFSPHRDYRVTRKIFGEIDASACSADYTFGKDGKPFFMPGPNDSPAKIERIMDTLMSRLGPEGFHFLMPLGAGGDVTELIDLEDEEEDWEDDEEEDSNT